MSDGSDLQQAMAMAVERASLPRRGAEASPTNNKKIEVTTTPESIIAAYNHRRADIQPEPTKRALSLSSGSRRKIRLATKEEEVFIKRRKSSKKKSKSKVASAATTPRTKGSKKQQQHRKSSNHNHPLTNITSPGINDCLFGRGGSTNNHPGNKHYRTLISTKKQLYLSSKRPEKQYIAMELVQTWRELHPPGRFLKLDDVTKLWYDVGDDVARVKVSASLRERDIIPTATKKNKNNDNSRGVMDNKQKKKKGGGKQKRLSSSSKRVRSDDDDDDEYTPPYHVQYKVKTRYDDDGDDSSSSSSSNGSSTSSGGGYPKQYANNNTKRRRTSRNSYYDSISSEESSSSRRSPSPLPRQEQPSSSSPFDKQNNTDWDGDYCLEYAQAVYQHSIMMSKR